MLALGFDVPTDARSRLLDVADLLALGYVRYRARQAALEARARRVESAQNALDDVPPRATLATGERRTSETGGDA
jgi:hypothetical protein